MTPIMAVRFVKKSAHSHNAMLAAVAQQLQSEIADDRRLLQELPTRIALKEQKLEAVNAAMQIGQKPASANRSLFRAPPPPPTAMDASEVARKPRDGVTWRSAVLEALSNAETGLDYKDTLEKATKAGLTRSKGDKGFYSAVAALCKSGDVVKHGGLLYTKAMVEKFRASGKPLPVAHKKNGGAHGLLLDLLREHSEGLTGPELQKRLSLNPDAPASVSKYPHYVYNMLAPLIGSGAVAKSENGKYKIAK